MRKISLATLSFFIGILGIFAKTEPIDSTNYPSRKLKVEEVNFLSSYYRQDGNRSPVTGGIGS